VPDEASDPAVHTDADERADAEGDGGRHTRDE
jgi:hypothetical protein